MSNDTEEEEENGGGGGVDPIAESEDSGSPAPPAVTPTKERSVVLEAKS